MFFLLFFPLFAFGQACQTPTLSQLSPRSGSVAGGATYTITGTNFCPGVVVDFGTQTSTITSQTATQITGILPPGMEGAVDLTITNQGVQSAIFSQAFLYVNPPAGLTASAGSPKFASIGQQVSFFGYVAGGTPGYVYWWNFGDGTTGSGKTGVHVYQKPGVYVVQFLVTDSMSEVALSSTKAYITTPTNFLLDDKGGCLTDDKGNCLTAN